MDRHTIIPLSNGDDICCERGAGLFWGRVLRNWHLDPRMTFELARILQKPQNTSECNLQAVPPRTCSKASTSTTLRTLCFQYDNTTRVFRLMQILTASAILRLFVTFGVVVFRQAARASHPLQRIAYRPSNSRLRHCNGECS